MASTDNSRLIYLDTLLNLSTIEHFDCWPLKGLRPVASDNITALYEHLKSQSENQPWNVYLRDVDMPPRWHFSASYRIAPLFMVPNPGWVIVNSKEEFDPATDGEYKPKGIHGYDNDNELMRSLFLARGPGLNYTYPVKPFNNTEVYGILTNLLKVQPNPHNGTFTRGRMQRLLPSALETAPATATNTTNTGDDIPEMSSDDWEDIEEAIDEEMGEEDFEAEEEAWGRPLTWKEFMEIKAEEMREEMESWWDWLSKHGGHKSG
jgi:hypothetical protein